MEYKNWEPIYKRIVRDLNISIEEDTQAASVLNELINNLKSKSNIDYLQNLIKNKQIVIFGAGPSLEINFEKKMSLFNKCLKFAADGATSFLLKNDIIPDVIVTDLDGKISDQVLSNQKGSIVIIHAHADNVIKITNYVGRFSGRIIGTTQTNPSKFLNLYNFGGFTDGDRAVCLSDHFRAKKLYLTGFDFDGVFGKYSFIENKNKKLKLQKLEWCKYIINFLEKENLEFI